MYEITERKIPELIERHEHVLKAKPLRRGVGGRVLPLRGVQRPALASVAETVVRRLQQPKRDLAHGGGEGVRQAARWGGCEQGESLV